MGFDVSEKLVFLFPTSKEPARETSIVHGQLSNRDMLDVERNVTWGEAEEEAEWNDWRPLCVRNSDVYDASEAGPQRLDRRRKALHAREQQIVQRSQALLLRELPCFSQLGRRRSAALRVGVQPERYFVLH